MALDRLGSGCQLYYRPTLSLIFLSSIYLKGFRGSHEFVCLGQESTPQYVASTTQMSRIALLEWDVCIVAGETQHGQGEAGLLEDGFPECHRPLSPLPRPPPPGFFFQPTVFTDVEDHMFIAKEESFGPIMIISRFANG